MSERLSAWVRVTLAVALALALQGCGLGLRMAPGATVVPEGGMVLPTRTCADYFLVEAMINGRGPFVLMLDTGASGTVLTPAAAAALDGATGPTLFAARGAIGRTVVVTQRARIDELNVGEMSLRDFDAIVMDLKGFDVALGGRLHGILGYPAFRDVLLTLDYPRQQVRLERGRLTEDGGGVVHRTRGRLSPSVAMEIQGKTAWAIVDSGSSGDLMLGNVGKLEYVVEPRVVGSVLAVGGTDLRRAGRAAGEARLGGRVLVEPLVEGRASMALIGTQILRHYCITFDQKAKLARFTSAESAPITFPSLFGIGVGVFPEPEGIRVTDVFEGSPAEAAGLQKGDLVRTMDGRRVAELYCERRRMFTSPGQIRLGVQRGEEAMELGCDVIVLVP